MSIQMLSTSIKLSINFPGAKVITTDLVMVMILMFAVHKWWRFLEERRSLMLPLELYIVSQSLNKDR